MNSRSTYLSFPLEARRNESLGPDRDTTISLLLLQLPVILEHHMIHVPKSLSVLYFAAGLLIGFFIGVSISREWSIMTTRILSAAAIVFIALFWRRIESFAHKQYMENWEIRRIHGKWIFVLTQYILLRGGLIFAAVVGPAFSRLSMSKETVATILVTLVLLAGIMTYLGYESWMQCERQYEVRVLRDAAERTRANNN